MISQADHPPAAPARPLLRHCGVMVAMARLAEALTAWEGHRAALEASTLEIVAALAAVREHVRASNADISRCREEVEMMHKRRRLCVPTGSRSSAAAAAAAATSASTVGDEAHVHAALQGAVAGAEGELQVLAQALATVEVPVQRMRARVEPLLDAERLAAAREARNEECSALVRLMGSAHLGEHEQSGAYILRSLSVVALWRLRRVSRSFRRWGTEALAAMPRPVVVGGYTRSGQATARVVALDMASLRWSSDIAVPSLPEPRSRHAMCGLPGGQIIVVGGLDNDDDIDDTVCGWQPDSSNWEALPSMRLPREDAVAVALGDGRVLVAGGSRWQQMANRMDNRTVGLASAEALAADGSRWSAVAPMHTARCGAVGGLLPGGQVIVAGGSVDDEIRPVKYFLATAELWDPVTNVWTELPPMATARMYAAGCVLQDGRFVVVGGCGALDDGEVSRWHDGEVYNCARNEWTRLPAPSGMVGGGRECAALVPVAGGMLILGGEYRAVEAELWDEESQRWLKLPHGMDTWRAHATAVPVPAVALCKAPATS
eukprot:COSAG01_NODE_1134_length_11558_cov_8.381360_3_plen_547_part_00